MKRPWFAVLGVLLVLAFSVLSCGPRVSQHVIESRAAVEAARAAGAPARSPEQFQLAEENLKESQTLTAVGDALGLLEADYRAAVAMAMAKSAMTAAKLSADLEKVQAEAQAAKQEAVQARSQVDRMQAQVRSTEGVARAAEARAERAEAQVAELRRQAAASPPIAVVPSHVRYVVKKGDTLPKIAARPEIYGDSSQWPRLYEANRDIIGKDRKVKAGQVLVVPKP